MWYDKATTIKEACDAFIVLGLIVHVNQQSMGSSFFHIKYNSLMVSVILWALGCDYIYIHRYRISYHTDK